MKAPFNSPTQQAHIQAPDGSIHTVSEYMYDGVKHVYLDDKLTRYDLSFSNLCSRISRDGLPLPAYTISDPVEADAFVNYFANNFTSSVSTYAAVPAAEPIVSLAELNLIAEKFEMQTRMDVHYLDVSSNLWKKLMASAINMRSIVGFDYCSSITIMENKNLPDCYMVGYNRMREFVKLFVIGDPSCVKIPILSPTDATHSPEPSVIVAIGGQSVPAEPSSPPVAAKVEDAEKARIAWSDPAAQDVKPSILKDEVPKFRVRLSEYGKRRNTDHTRILGTCTGYPGAIGGLIKCIVVWDHIPGAYAHDSRELEIISEISEI
jgi:hypothetical protein